MNTAARVIAGSVAGIMAISIGAVAFAPVAILAGAIMGPELKNALNDMGIHTRRPRRYHRDEEPIEDPPDVRRSDTTTLRNERYFDRQRRNR